METNPYNFLVNNSIRYLADRLIATKKSLYTVNSVFFLLCTLELANEVKKTSQITPIQLA